MKQVLKQGVLQGLRSAGVFSVATHFRRNSLVILCYHGISLRDEHEWAGGLYITPEQFRLRLEWLRDWRANVLALGEALERLQAGTLPARSVVITFDDGFYDFYKYAWPMLTEFGYPCTLYLTTYYCLRREPIPNLLASYLEWKGSADYGDRMFEIVTPDEAAEMARSGIIDLQLHTHRHRVPLDRELFLREIRDNSAVITEISGREPRHFCYPSGVTAPEFLPWLREAGVVSATTCVHGLAKPDTEPLMLPRYLDGSAVQRLDFEGWLSGLR